MKEQPTRYRLAGLVLFLGLVGVAARADYYEGALEEFDRGDFPSAIVHLKNALAKNPQSLAARILLGRAYLALDAGAAAETAFRQARAHGADDALVQVPLGEAYLLQQKFEALLDDIEPLGRAKQVDAQIEILRGHAFFGLRELTAAETSFRNAMRLSQRPVKALLGLARVFAQRDKAEEALGYANQALELAPNDAEAWLVSGEVHRRAGQTDKALAEVSRALALDPELEEARLRRALVLVDSAEHASALPDLEWLLAKYPGQPLPSYVLGLVQKALGNVQAAEDAFSAAARGLEKLTPEGKRANPEHVLLHGLIDVERKNQESARRYLERYLKRDHYNPQARRALGQLLLESGKGFEAIAVLEPLVDLYPEGVNGLVLLAAAYFETQNYERAIRHYRRAVKQAPRRMAIELELARSLYSAGDIGGASARLEFIYGRRDSPAGVGVLLAKVKLAQGAYVEARGVAEQLLMSDENVAEYHYLNGQALLGGGKRKPAIESFRRATILDPTFVLPYLRLGEIYIDGGEWVSAAAAFRSALSLDVASLPAHIGLSRLAEASDATEEALAHLEKGLSHLGARDRRRVGVARRFLALRAPARALDAIEGLRRLSPDALELLEIVARAETLLGRTKDAVVTYGRLVRFADHRAGVLFRAGVALYRLGEVEDARFALRMALQVAPEMLGPLSALAVLETRAGNRDRAAALFKRVASLDQSDARVQIATAAIHRQLGEHEAALRHYERAHALAPRSGTVLALFDAYVVNQRGPQGVALLESWLEAHSADRRVRERLAQLYVGLAQPERAQEHYAILVSQLPENPEFLNGLAWSFTLLEDSRAVETALEALKRKPADHAIMDTVGWAYVLAGKASLGLPYLRDAVARDASNPVIRYHLAVALEDAGKRAEASRHFEKVATHPVALREVADARRRLARE